MSDDDDTRALADALWDAPADADLGFRQNCDAMAAHLIALGYRLTLVEHTHHTRGYPAHVMDDEMLERMGPFPATHRRRTYHGPWERMPADEHASADMLTYGSTEP